MFRVFGSFCAALIPHNRNTQSRVQRAVIDSPQRGGKFDGIRVPQSSLSPRTPVPIERSADQEMVSQGEIAPWLWVAAVQHRMCGDDGTHAVVDDTVYRRLRPRLPQEPHPSFPPRGGFPR